MYFKREDHHLFTAQHQNAKGLGAGARGLPQPRLPPLERGVGPMAPE